MSKIAERFYNWAFGEKRQTSGRRMQKRFYAAARSDRLNANWGVTPYTANYVNRTDASRLVARAREMCRDTPHGKKFLSMVRSNVIGPKGMRLQVKAYQPDKKTLNVDLNKRVEAAFWEWGHRETCSISGKLDWIAAQRLFVTQLARDGEVLVQKIAADNAFGFSLKFIDVTYLDYYFNEELANGNRIIMSVEIDDNGVPQAYWLTTPSSDVMFAKQRQYRRIRVPADQMIHAFLVHDDESQVRGVTWFHAALKKSKNYDTYCLSVEEQAKMTAMAGGFFTKTTPDEVEWEGQENAEGEPSQPEIDFQPGSFIKIPDGLDFKQFDPKQPTQNHAAFCQQILSDLAAGVDLPYFSLAGDLSSVNYSSARIGLGEEREIWKSLHQFVAAVFCRPVYHAWLDNAVRNRAVKLTAEEYKQVQNPTFRGRGWQYIDPMKEIEAATLGLANNIQTLTDTLAEQGIDIVDHFEVIQAERALAKAYGIDLVYTTKVTATEAADPKAGEGDSTAIDTPKSPPKRELTNGHDYTMIEN